MKVRKEYVAVDELLLPGPLTLIERI